jgi:hypothetical protein
MIRMFIIWLILSVLIYVGIVAWQKFSGKEKWQLTKTAGYAIVCSLLSVLILSGFVLLF